MLAPPVVGQAEGQVGHLPLLAPAWRRLWLLIPQHIDWTAPYGALPKKKVSRLDLRYKMLFA